MKLPHQRWLEIGVVAIVVVILAAVLLPAIRQAREAAHRSQSENNLKQIGIAFSNYVEIHDVFPPGAVVDSGGVGHHGWAAQILPYIDQNPFYVMVDKGQPWDSEANRPVFQQRYFPFEAPDTLDAYTRDGFAISCYTASPAAFFRNSSTRLSEIADTSTAWALAEVHAREVPWGYPFNWRDFPTNLVDDSQGFLRESGVAHVLMVDGRVETLSKETDSAVLRSLTDGCPEPTMAQSRVPDRVFEFLAKPEVRIPMLVGSHKFDEDRPHWVYPDDE
ncbi:MAG: DUF1559 domain-containing protein [Planctomycetota bacterium]|nr:DUF1559 domain-containing protein [Planctomycetota bacterium]MDA1248738.1 DUF1559 domain-containing protein [Planctomycetota bacterium]